MLFPEKTFVLHPILRLFTFKEPHKLRVISTNWDDVQLILAIINDETKIYFVIYIESIRALFNDPNFLSLVEDFHF